MKYLERISVGWLFFLAHSILTPIASAGTFAVATREDLLQLTARIQATQFLTHATFGPTEVEVNTLADRMRQIGTIAAATEWIDSQLNLPLSNESRHLTLAESMIAEDFQFCTAVNSNGVAVPMDATRVPIQTRYRQSAWYHRAITNSDQLRQKLAWALSQILSVGNDFANFNNTQLEGTPIDPVRKPRYLGLSNYYDVFVDNALLRYRDVLQAVSYHAIMGDWLSSRGNAKEDLLTNRFPDENFAREVMQLFSIGLYLLDDDGTQRLDGLGVPMPTYTQDHIREYAQVFTGLGYNTSGNNGGTFSSAVRYQTPMTMVASQHDTSSKVLLHGTLPALGENPLRADCNGEISSALDGLVNHQSCPPFISRLLIQRLVKSNPSRAYLQRIVQVFKNNGANVRGDLKAVVKAILLDPEAFQPIRTQYLRNPNRIVVTTLGTEDSRLQEPVVAYTRYFRFFKGLARYERGQTTLNQNQTGVITTFDQTGPAISNQFRLQSRVNEFLQSPYESPTVFNFYFPDYRPSGEFLTYLPSARIPNATLVAPEFQILDALTSNRTANLYRNVTRAGTREETYLPPGNFRPGSPPSVTNATTINQISDVTTTLVPTRCRVVFDASADQTYSSFARQSAIASLATAAINGSLPLVEHLDLYLCGGTLNESYRLKLVSLLDELRASYGTTINANQANELARAAIQCVATSSSFLITE
jgi:uncharacterized protein (DUF1800 family)